MEIMYGGSIWREEDVEGVYGMNVQQDNLIITSRKGGKNVDISEDTCLVTRDFSNKYVSIKLPTIF
jgi:hypothetical protein